MRVDKADIMGAFEEGGMGELRKRMRERARQSATQMPVFFVIEGNQKITESPEGSGERLDKKKKKESKDRLANGRRGGLHTGGTCNAPKSMEHRNNIAIPSFPSTPFFPSKTLAGGLPCSSPLLQALSAYSASPCLSLLGSGSNK